MVFVRLVHHHHNHHMEYDPRVKIHPDCYLHGDSEGMLSPCLQHQELDLYLSLRRDSLVEMPEHNKELEQVHPTLVGRIYMTMMIDNLHMAVHLSQADRRAKMA